MIPRYFFYSSKCDFYEPLEPLPIKQAHIVTSDKDSLRFDRETAHFNSFKKNSDENKLRLHIDREGRRQKIVGFGGAFTDAATRNIKTLGQGQIEDLLR